MKYLIVLVLSIIGMQAYAAERFQQYSTQIDGVAVHYYLTLPEKKSFPLVVLVQGSTCESGKRIFNKSNASKYSNQVATLIVEKPGIDGEIKDCPQAYLKNNTIDFRVKSYLQIVGELKSSLKNWSHEVLWFGGSEGGVVASLAAAKTSETKALAILVTGGGMTMADDILMLTEKQMKEGKAPQAAIDDQLAKTKTAFQEIRDNPSWEKEWMSDGKLARNTYKWWNSILDLKVSDSLLSLNKPIYMAHGSSDTSTPVESADRVAEMFKSQKKTNLVYKRYDGIGHDFKDQQGQFHQEIIDSAMEWLVKN